jgi:ABC-type glycerol-3-phosphate transport system substrate-binding protein
MGGSAWVPPAATKNKEEAWELMQHLTSPEVERAQIKHVGIMPARRAVLDEYAAEEPPKHMKLVLRAAEAAILIPQTPWYPEAESAALSLLNELWESKRSAGVTGQEIKRQVDEILKQPFAFKGA